MRSFGGTMRSARRAWYVAAICGAFIACHEVSPSTTPGAPAIAAPGRMEGPAAIPLAGCPPFYTAEVTVGGSQQFHVVLDTGSTTTAISSTWCPSCAHAGVHRFYRPGPTSVDVHRAAGTDYGTSGWSGKTMEDTVSLGGVTIATPVDFVAITEQRDFLRRCPSSPDGYQGIVGLGPSWAALPGTEGALDRLADGGSNDEFAVELCSSGLKGTLWVGGFDAAATTAPPAYTPTTERGMVVLSDIAVGGASLGLPASAYGEALLDTGSPVTQLPSAVFGALTAAIDRALLADPELGRALHACFRPPIPYEAAKADLDARLPPLTLTFGVDRSVVLRLPATESYLRAMVDPATRQTQWCAGIVEVKDKTTFLVLGAPLMQTYVTIFDRRNRRVGFAPHTACDAL